MVYLLEQPVEIAREPNEQRPGRRGSYKLYIPLGVPKKMFILKSKSFINSTQPP